MAARCCRIRHHPDLGDQAAQDLRRFQLQLWLVQRCRKIGDLLAIEVREARMQPQGRGIGCVFEEGGQPVFRRATLTP